MAKIAILVAQEFEDSEFRVPYDRLREAGHVEDGNLISSRKPDDLEAFSRAILKRLEQAPERHAHP